MEGDCCLALRLRVIMRWVGIDLWTECILDGELAWGWRVIICRMALIVVGSRAWLNIGIMGVGLSQVNRR